ncbi:hypothetical protein MAR_025636 [Mya arenaria]|uniref:Cadherin domain-containing protein n=1 Tax=Mya arenaria TaxID=6604 RepID=A0ABY7EW98_MYAAR|nr:hypothetical protein MAR_025636 [Mya arenaria]
MIRVVSIVLIWANFTGAVVSNWNTPLPGTAGRGNESIIWAGSVLELSATDSQDSGRGTATVTVKVQDLNDNSPMFTSSVYNNQT